MNPFNNCSFVGRIPTHEAFKINYVQGEGEKRSRYNTVLAVKRDRKRPDEQYYKDDLIPITAWGPTADYLSRWAPRGSMIAVAGSLNIETVESNDGSKRTYYNITVESARVVSSGENNNNSNNNGGYQQRQNNNYSSQQQPQSFTPPAQQQPMPVSEYQNSGFNPFNMQGEGAMAPPQFQDAGRQNPLGK